MAKRPRHHRGGGRVTPKGTRPRSHGGRGSHDEPPIVDDTRARLRERSPFSLLAYASSLIEASTVRPLDGLRGDVDKRVSGDAFLSFAESGWPMNAMALAIAAMHPDELLAARIRNAVDPRDLSHAPAWINRIAQIEVTSTSTMNDVLGDGENLIVAWRWPDGAECTAVIYVDHNMGTLVKDAFVIPDGLDEFIGHVRDFNEAASISVDPIDGADLRARYTEAVELYERSLPPIVTESWPVCRPMIEWVLRQLPPDGVGYERPERTDEQRDQLLDEFLDSPFADVRGVSRADVRELADPLLWFGTDYGPGDPLRWSPTSVEIVLADWYPRKVLGLGKAKRKLPDVLAAFVRYCHDRTGIPADRTAETLESVERWRREYLRAIERPGRGPESNAIDMARMVAAYARGVELTDDDDDDDFLIDLTDDDFDDFDDDDDFIALDDDLDDETYIARAADMLEATLIEMVGGRDAYDALTDEPLADRRFDGARVPEPMRELTAETLAYLDKWSVELFDAEVRTIARAVLEAVVDEDRGVFKRSPRSEALAAGILAFVMARLTGSGSTIARRSQPWKVRTQKALAAATDVSASTISARSRTVRNVIERSDIDWPALLHSSQRREILEGKSALEEWRSQQV